MILYIDRVTHEEVQDGGEGTYEVLTPPGSYEWSPPLRAFRKVLTLAERKAARWQLVKIARDRAEWSGCATPKGRVDTDVDSQRKVNGSVTLALISQSSGHPFALDWTMQDNSVQPHDAVEMIGLGVAVAMHVAACHEVALAKREAIGSAEDPASVGVDDGWPS